MGVGVTRRKATAGSSEKFECYRGFTLVEVLVVIIIIGLLAYSATFLWPTGVGRAGVARQISHHIQLARSLSMERGGGSIQFTSATAYDLRDSGGVAIPGFAFTLSGGVTMTTRPTSIAFDRLGRPTFVGGATITLTAEGGTSTLTVTTETGSVIGP